MHCLRKDTYVVILMSGHALKRPEYLEPVFKRVYDKPEDKMDKDNLAKLSGDYAIIIKKQSDGSHTITGLSRDSIVKTNPDWSRTVEKPVYMEITIDKKTSDEALKAFSRLGTKHPTGATEIMRRMYGKFDKYAGIDAEEAKLITRAFLAISETGESEQKVAYQRAYFKGPKKEKEDDWELPTRILRRGGEKELTAIQQALKNNVDRFLNDYRLAVSNPEKSISMALSQSYDNSGLLRTVLDDLKRAKKELPGVYKPRELNGAIEQYGNALIIVQGLELQEPTIKPQTEHEKPRPRDVVPGQVYKEKKTPSPEQKDVIGRVEDYFKPLSVDLGGTMKERNAKRLDTNVIQIILRDMKEVNGMIDEYKVPATLGRYGLERTIKVLQDELDTRKK